MLKKFFSKRNKANKKENKDMKKVLYITANPKAEQESFSLKAGQLFIKKYIENNPNDEVTTLNLYDLDIPFIDEDVFSGWGKLSEGVSFGDLTENEQYKVGTINQYTEQFINADKYIFATPMWNLSLPPKVKMYIDTLMIAGKTFRYTENGPEGLLEKKKAFHIHASGGVYSQTELSAIEFGDSYLKAVLGFMGVTDYDSILLEGTAMAQDAGHEIHQNAQKQIDMSIPKF